MLHELKATKEVLLSSLNTVHGLEEEAIRIPELEARIATLELQILAKRLKSINLIKYISILTLSRSKKKSSGSLNICTMVSTMNEYEPYGEGKL